MPKAQRVSSEGVTHEERLHLIDEHRARRTEALVDTELKGAATYEAMRGLVDVGAVTHPVKCPLPGYGHLTVQYRTSIPSRRRRERPFRSEPAELRDLRARFAAMASDDPEYLDVYGQIMQLDGAFQSDYRVELAHWLSLFVRGIDGWNFSLGGEAIPAPNPTDPTTYEVLPEEFEDLFIWLSDKGYEQALVVASGGSEPA